MFTFFYHFLIIAYDDMTNLHQCRNPISNNQNNSSILHRLNNISDSCLNFNPASLIVDLVCNIFEKNYRGSWSS